MAGRRRGRYPPEYKERIVELVRAGRSPGSLAREFEPSEQTIRNWVKQADLDEGLQSDGLTTEARKELRELKREVKRRRMERAILEHLRIELKLATHQATCGRRQFVGPRPTPRDEDRNLGTHRFLASPRRC